MRIDQTYDPVEVEAGWYAFLDGAGAVWGQRALR